MHKCGPCTLCCTLVPVDSAALKKPAFTPCKHLRDMLLVAGPGCGIYETRPDACRAWSCVWLTSPDMPIEGRPDRCGVVIDPTIDLIRVNGEEQAAAQIWVAPGHEMAFETEIVTAMIAGLLEQVPFVLWRQRGADGTQWARAITRNGDGARRADAGGFGISPLTKADKSLGTELERWARVDQLMSSATEAT